jgi:tRNA-dihydrouridine synthase B
MRIGPHELATRWVLAPMAGISEKPFRSLAFRMGAGLCPTELVSAEGLMRASARTLRYLRRDPAWERPFSVQVFGGRPEVLAEAAKVARDHGADIIDVNMGCPVPKVTKSGAGCALMAEPSRAAEVIARIAGSTGLPVTAKIRSGIDAQHLSFLEVGRALQDAGCAALAIHPRTRVQGYAGRANWEHIRELKAALRIPVIGNGDVISVEDAHRMLATTGCDAVMIGRGALGNPWIFRELAGGPAATLAERGEVTLAHFDEHLEFCGDERRAVHQFRKHVGWYTRGLVGAAAFRARVMTLEPAVEVRRELEGFFGAAELDHRSAAADDDGVDYRAAYG